MKDYLFTVDALDPDDTPQTLRFSIGGYIDDDAIPYKKRINKQALFTVSPNDGGLLSLFTDESIGDIELINVDHALDYLKTYRVDGRAASITIVESDGSLTPQFAGTIGRMTDDGATIVFNLKLPQESLDNPYPMAVYAGDNAPPAGLEGTEDTIGGDVKPQMFGYGSNISPVLVNALLQIYQVSSRADCVITMVYDDGVPLGNHRTSGSHSIAATTINLVTGSGAGLGDIPAGAQIMFSNHLTIYEVDVGLTAGVIELVTGLTAAVPAKAFVTIINFYVDTDALQYTNYFVDGDQDAGETDIAIDGGVGAIDAGDLVMFGNQVVAYSVGTELTAGVIVLDDALDLDIDDGDVVHVVGPWSPALWGGFQGYFRLSAKPSGAITCDAISIDVSGAVHQAGDVFELIADEVGYTVDPDGVTAFNSAGIVRLPVMESVNTLELFNKIAKSVGGYYYGMGGVFYLGLLTVPAVTPDWTLYDYQIDKATRSATGLGQNGLPMYAVRTQYDPVDTVQTSVGGSVSSARRQRIKEQYRELITPDADVLIDHPLSERLEVESLLSTKAATTTLNSRLLSLVSADRDVIQLTIPRSQVQSYTIGSTGLIYSNRLDYASGRLMVLAYYECDHAAGIVTQTLYG